jgi:hypothetical protein
MPRKSAETPDIKTSPVNELVVMEGSAALNQLSRVDAQGQAEGRDLANQMLGQIQMSRAISKFTDVVSLSKLKIIKENKIYRGLAGQKAQDANGQEIPDVGTWVGFCMALGVSASKIDEDLTNLKIFGEDALEQMQRTGIGYREMRQFRKLPTDAKTALIEAAKAGDTDTLLELAEDLMAKHIKEKAALQKEVEARDQRIARHAAKIQEYEDAADAKLATPVHTQVAESAALALGVMQGELRDSFEKLGEHHVAQGTAVDGREVMSGYVAQLQQQLNELREAFMLSDTVGDGTPDWKKWAAKQNDKA